MRVGQGSALLSVLSALYLSPLLYIFEKQLEFLKIPISILSFIDNGLFITLYCLKQILSSFQFEPLL